MNAITTPRSRSTEFTRHRLATGDGPSPEAPAANSDLVPALIKFTRSFFMGFSTRWRRHAQVTLHVGDGRWEMICGEAVETRGEKGKRRDEPQRFFNAKGQGIEGGHRYSTARDCCAADSSVGRLLTRAVLYRIRGFRLFTHASFLIGLLLDIIHLALRLESPNGSWGIVKVQPTAAAPTSRIPPTAVGGWLKPRLLSCRRGLLTGFGRPDLNYPPTAVGGI